MAERYANLKKQIKEKGIVLTEQEKYRLDWAGSIIAACNMLEDILAR